MGSTALIGGLACLSFPRYARGSADASSGLVYLQRRWRKSLHRYALARYVSRIMTRDHS